MKKIIPGLAVIACVALCAVVWPRSDEIGDLPAEPVKTAVSAEIEARSEEVPSIFISADTPASETEPVAENEPEEVEVTAEKETEKPAPSQSVKQSPTSSEPHNGDVRVVDGEKQIYLLGFGWIKDEVGGSVGTMVGNPCDRLTGHKVGIIGGGTVAENMYENGHKIGIMGGDNFAPSNSLSPPPKQPEITGDIIYTELQTPVTKDSTPPAYKPNGEPYNP